MPLPQRFIQRTYVIRLEYRRVVDEECEGAERRESRRTSPASVAASPRSASTTSADAP
jgi:hypothetical protein